MPRLLQLIMNNKKIVCGLSLAIMIPVVFYYNVFMHGSYINVEHYDVREVLLEDDSLSFKGYIYSSADAFSGYKYEVIDENVYLSLRYSMVSRFNRSASSKILINDDFSSVKNVYLLGRGNDDVRLILSR